MINKDGTVVVGKKGRSGRKSRYHETAKIEAIQAAWEKVLRSINVKDVERIALPLALKDMTEKKEVHGSMAVQQITGMVIQDANYEDKKPTFLDEAKEEETLLYSQPQTSFLIDPNNIPAKYDNKFQDKNSKTD